MLRSALGYYFSFVTLTLSCVACMWRLVASSVRVSIAVYLLESLGSFLDRLSPPSFPLSNLVVYLFRVYFWFICLEKVPMLRRRVSFFVCIYCLHAVVASARHECSHCFKYPVAFSFSPSNPVSRSPRYKAFAASPFPSTHHLVKLVEF